MGFRATLNCRKCKVALTESHVQNFFTTKQKFHRAVFIQILAVKNHCRVFRKSKFIVKIY